MTLLYLLGAYTLRKEYSLIYKNRTKGCTE